jgi:hypothetical protein
MTSYACIVIPGIKRNGENRAIKGGEYEAEDERERMHE